MFCWIGVAGLFWPGLALSQPQVLSDTVLSGVTAGSQAAAAPAAMNGESAEPGGFATGAARAVVVESELETVSSSQVLLGEEAQSKGNALNLVNVSVADSVQAVNIFSARTSGAAPAYTVSTAQANAIGQQAMSPGDLIGFATAGGERDMVHSSFRTVAQNISSDQRIERLDRSHRTEIVTTRLNETVIPERIGFFDTPVELGVGSVDLAPFTINPGPVSVRFPSEGLSGKLFDVADEYLEISVDIEPWQVAGATLSFGKVVLEGDDILLQGPSLTLGGNTFGFCFFPTGGCDPDDRDYASVTIPGGTFKLADITLEGANPLGELGVELGYAIAGDGTITFDAGSVSFSGDISLDLGTIANTFQLNIPDAKFITDFTDQLDIPSIALPVNLDLDLPVPDGFNRELQQQACVASDSGQSCRPLDTTRVSASTQNNGVTTTSSRQQSDSEQHVDIRTIREHGVLELRAGQSRLLVIRRSDAREERYNLVTVSGNAQNGLAAMNAVNASFALIGNGVNVFGAASPGTPSAIPGSLQMSQNNAFRQIGGL